MTKLHNLVVIAFAVLISAAIWLYTWDRHVKKKKKITANVFHGIYGWGYNILVDDTLFIHQETIPARQGKKGFPEKKLAEQTVQLIINKMERGELPTVTTFEMEQIMPLK